MFMNILKISKELFNLDLKSLRAFFCGLKSPENHEDLTEAPPSMFDRFINFFLNLSKIIFLFRSYLLHLLYNQLKLKDYEKDY